MLQVAANPLSVMECSGLKFPMNPGDFQAPPISTLDVFPMGIKLILLLPFNLRLQLKLSDCFVCSSEESFRLITSLFPISELLRPSAFAAYCFPSNVKLMLSVSPLKSEMPIIREAFSQ